MNGDLAGAGLEHKTGQTDYVADIKFLKAGVYIFTNAVSCNIALNSALIVLNIAKACLAHYSL